MPQVKKLIREYYGQRGSYLKEHRFFFNKKNLQRDIKFIIDVLKLKRNDHILDLGCADGRITYELNRRGYFTDGVDFSKHMLSLARSRVKLLKRQPVFYHQDLNNLKIKKKYNKVMMFFPDWRAVDLNRLLTGLEKIVPINGLFLYDHDNLNRLLESMKKRKNVKRYYFNTENMELIDKGYKKGDRFYSLNELEDIFKKYGFRIIEKFDGWEKEPLNEKSKRMIVLAFKK